MASWVYGYSENPIHNKDRAMFNNLDFDLNAKEKFTWELSVCGVNGSRDVAG
jgi:hypothetical protein